MRWKMNKSMKWSWFKVPVKVEQINENLFSDTVQSQWKQKVAVMKWAKVNTGDIRPNVV